MRIRVLYRASGSASRSGDKHRRAVYIAYGAAEESPSTKRAPDPVFDKAQQSIWDQIDINKHDRAYDDSLSDRTSRAQTSMSIDVGLQSFIWSSKLHLVFIDIRSSSWGADDIV